MLEEMTEQELAQALRERLPEEMMDAVDIMQFGRKVAEFVNDNEIGQWLFKKAWAERSQAEMRLLELPVNDPKVPERLYEFRMMHEIIKWFGEAIAEGTEAERLILDEEGAGHG